MKVRVLWCVCACLGCVCGWCRAMLCVSRDVLSVGVWLRMLRDVVCVVGVVVLVCVAVCGSGVWYVVCVCGVRVCVC